MASRKIYFDESEALDSTLPDMEASESDILKLLPKSGSVYNSFISSIYKILRWCIKRVQPMVGATTSNSGRSGIVPKPSAVLIRNINRCSTLTVYIRDHTRVLKKWNTGNG